MSVGGGSCLKIAAASRHLLNCACLANLLALATCRHQLHDLAGSYTSVPALAWRQKVHELATSKSRHASGCGELEKKASKVTPEPLSSHSQQVT